MTACLSKTVADLVAAHKKITSYELEMEGPAQAPGKQIFKLKVIQKRVAIKVIGIVCGIKVFQILIAPRLKYIMQIISA